MKKFWVFPLAALLCGRPVDPPRLKEPLPDTEGYCLASAQKLFLLSFAYQQESAAQSQRLRDSAAETLKGCEEPILRARLEKLKSSTP